MKTQPSDDLPYLDIEDHPSIIHNYPVTTGSWLHHTVTIVSTPTVAEAENLPRLMSQEAKDSILPLAGSGAGVFFVVGLVLFLFNQCEEQAFSHWKTRECMSKNVGAILMITAGSVGTLALIIGGCALLCLIRRTPSVDDNRCQSLIN